MKAGSNAGGDALEPDVNNTSAPKLLTQPSLRTSRFVIVSLKWGGCPKAAPGSAQIFTPAKFSRIGDGLCLNRGTARCWSLGSRCPLQLF